MRIILSAIAVWAAAKDADVEENVRIASMMVRKSGVEIVIYCGGGAEVLGLATSVGVVLGVEGSEEIERSGAGGIGAVVAGVGRGDAGIECAGA